MTVYNRDGCPNAAAHTKGQPDGYIAWHEWAGRKSRTHHQIRCKGCGRYEIWIPGVVEPDGVPEEVTIVIGRDERGRQTFSSP